MKPTSIALTSTLCGAPSCESTLVSAMPAARVIEVGALPLGADMEHVDAAAPPALLHLRPPQPRQPDGGEQLLVQVLLQEFVGQLFERAGGRRAGIVHEDVDLTERLHYFVVGTLDIS